MKEYQVVFAAEAQQEAINAALYIAETAPLNAVRWYDELEAVITSLKTFPNRGAVAPESDLLGDQHD